jgi:MFS family permease
VDDRPARAISSRHALLALTALGVANHAALAGSRVAVSLDALASGSSPATVGVLIALFALLPALFAVAVGRVSDRGTRAPLLAGSVGVALGALLPFVWPGLVTLFACSAAVGIAFVTFQVAAQNATGALGTPAERARNFSVLALGYSVSGLLGPLIAGYAIDHAGYRATFGLLALLPLPGIVALARGRPKLPGPHRAQARDTRASVMDLLAHRTLRRVFAMNVLIAMAWDLHTIFVPVYGAEIGLSASRIGVILAAFAAATFVVRLAMPVVVRYATEHQALVASLFVAGGVYLAFPFVEQPAALMALSFTLGLGVGGGQPMVMSLLHAHAPAGRMGEAAGVRMSLVNAMAVGVPLAFGALGASVGIAPVLWSVGAGLGVGGWLARKRRS